MSREVMLIDGLNTFIRNWAVNPTLDDDGEHVGGTVGTLRSIKSMAREQQPAAVVVAWDPPGGSRKRRGIFSEYKAGRKPRVNRSYDFGEDADASRRNMQGQEKKVRKYLDLLGVRQVEVDGLEADDVIAIACKHVYQDVPKVIVSTDNDFWQLVDGLTMVYYPTKREFIGPDEVKAAVGCLPENHVILKSIVRDRSDAVLGPAAASGLKGLGPRTVVKLVPALAERELTLQEVYEFLEAARPTGEREQALVSATLHGWDTVVNNYSVMQLSTAALGPPAVRTVKAACAAPWPQFNSTGARLALTRDGIQIQDPDLFAVFRDLAARSAAEFPPAEAAD